MGHERIKGIKENLLANIEGQVCNIRDADAEELGAAIDMLKDLEEALYYCTITEAMEGKGNNEFKLEKKHYENEDRSYYSRPMQMYYGSSQSYNNGGSQSYNNGGSQSYSNGGTRYSQPMRDVKEGRSPEVRRMYMEAREMNLDKTTQLKELEHYVQELSSDVVDMISEAGTEEKQYLEKKLLALASKIGQMK